MDSADYSPNISNAVVVTVNYFKAERLLQSIRSLGAQDISDQLSIAIVDNSCDRAQRDVIASAPDLKNVGKLVFAERNLGYTKGCNLGVAALPKAPYVLLCNPDIIWDDSEAVRKLLEIADRHPDIGVLAPLQVDDSGRHEEIARNFPTLMHQIIRRTVRGADEKHLLAPLLSRDGIQVIEADWLQSSCVLVRRDLWDAIGGLNESYFLFMSDIELCLQAWRRGYRVCITSAAQVRSDGLRASNVKPNKILKSAALRTHVRDSLRFYFRHGFRRLSRDGRRQTDTATATQTDVLTSTLGTNYPQRNG
jgi:N-acetylglucosaminyl-diphospho-decaprenol L-rhamnosyltransferase